MVYIKGEEMTRYTMQLILDKWIEPHMDTSSWEYYDLCCKSRDSSEDQVLRDAVEAGKRIKAIFKEPTVTPTEVQKQELGLKQTWGSPNGAMRRGWNGITISRDTIMIEGMELGYKKPVLFERHAVGGEYSAGYATVGKGELRTMFYPKGVKTEDVSHAKMVDVRQLHDEASAVVTYDNPLDNVVDLAHHFFSRCLKARVTPYVVTKKTVFKWQEGFWTRMKETFDEHYRERFREAELLENTGGELRHLISDAATMQLIRWTEGGFGMAAHNYDGDMLTDELAQIHRSPGFITSNLIGKAPDGSIIKEFEASHGTVSDMWLDHLDKEETSLNPLGLVEALIGAMQHAAAITEVPEESAIVDFTTKMRKFIHRAFAVGKGTRDISGPEGLTTEDFVDLVAKALAGDQATLDLLAADANLGDEKRSRRPPIPTSSFELLNKDEMRRFFDSLDLNNDEKIDYDEFEKGMLRLGVFPKKYFPEGPPKF
ncbi:Isocitrate dehydrogenase (NAD(+)) [Durusdinium trenchii]|uniref:Mitochondrial (OtIDH) n=1 Tax=Durusdinium trenchii TaxID=1381693 RepID=A0ABP0MRP7_9DINO